MFGGTASAGMSGLSNMKMPSFGNTQADPSLKKGGMFGGMGGMPNMGGMLGGAFGNVGNMFGGSSDKKAEIEEEEKAEPKDEEYKIEEDSVKDLDEVKKEDGMLH